MRSLYVHKRPLIPEKFFIKTFILLSYFCAHCIRIAQSWRENSKDLIPLCSFFSPNAFVSLFIQNSDYPRKKYPLVSFLNPLSFAILVVAESDGVRISRGSFFSGNGKIYLSSVSPTGFHPIDILNNRPA